jgi:hypothetical protein
MTIHKQVWIKVNAQVDRGIAPLIEALSVFPGLRTIESCEGNEDTAWVTFDSGEDEWKPLAELVLEELGPSLMHEFGDRVSLNVTITEGGLYRAEMTLAKAAIPAVSKSIKQLLRTAKAA